MKLPSKKGHPSVMPIDEGLHLTKPQRLPVRVELERAIYMTCVSMAELVKALGVLENALDKVLHEPEDGVESVESGQRRPPVRVRPILTS
jgi:hypothetical protein